MNEACRFEREVLADRWTDELREHVASCEDCAAAAAVAPWIERFAALPDREHILPHPAILWLKAQVLRNSAEAARVSRPMTYVQVLAYLVVAAGWAAVLTWKWDAIQKLIQPITTSGFAAGASPMTTITTFATLMVLATMTVTLALHTILAEE